MRLKRLKGDDWFVGYTPASSPYIDADDILCIFGHYVDPTGEYQGVTIKFKSDIEDKRSLKSSSVTISEVVACVR